MFEEGCAYRGGAGFDEVGGRNGLRPSGSLTLAARRVLHVGAFFFGEEGVEGEGVYQGGDGFLALCAGGGSWAGRLCHIADSACNLTL